MLNGTKTLIVGDGEIGKSLEKVLSKTYQVKVKGIEDIDFDPDIIHICFPYSDKFVKECKRLMHVYKPHLVIIHSTVEPGTTRKLGEKFVYSPVRGKHPNLAPGMTTFVKFLAGENPYLTMGAAVYLRDADMDVEFFSDTESLEFAKIMSTTKYGWDIVFCKLLKEICDERGYNFDDVYTNWTATYNDGYVEMGQQQFRRPILTPIDGKIGGHCVVQNCDIVKNELTNLVKRSNDRF